MSRRGSMTSPTPRSVSAMTKLALPSSGAAIASTVYMCALAERDRDGRDHAALREGEPVKEAQKRGTANHRPNQIRTKAITPEATAHRPNCERTIRLGGTGRSRTLR